MSGIVLALDLGTRVGWAVGLPGARPFAGAVDLKGISEGQRYAGFLDWLDDAVRVHGKPQRVAYEAVEGMRWKSPEAGRALITLRGLLLLWGFDNVVKVEGVNVSTARKGMIGRGTFRKGEAKDHVAAWCERNGITNDDPNARDALLLWHHATGYRPQGSIAA